MKYVVVTQLGPVFSSISLDSCRLYCRKNFIPESCIHEAPIPVVSKGEV